MEEDCNCCVCGNPRLYCNSGASGGGSALRFQNYERDAMNNKFFVGSEVDRIDLGDGFWVDIKRRMSYYDHHLLTNAYITVNKSKERLELKNELAEGETTLLLINIKKWNLPDKDGKIAPINPTTVADLDRNVGLKIAAEIGKRNPNPKV